MKLLDNIKKIDNGSKFWKCDLHIHTPASYDFSEKIIFLFSWDEIPGSDNEKRINFLNQNFGIELAKTAEIEKIDDESIGNIVCCGAIDKQEIKDHVTTLLEGGKEAFTKRLEKYGF